MASTTVIARSCGNTRAPMSKRELPPSKLGGLHTNHALREPGPQGERTCGPVEAAPRLAHVEEGCFAKACRALVAGPPRCGEMWRPGNKGAGTLLDAPPLQYCTLYR